VQNAELIIKANGAHSSYRALKGTVYYPQSLHNIEKDAMIGEHRNEKTEKQTAINFSRYYSDILPEKKKRKIKKASTVLFGGLIDVRTGYVQYATHVTNDLI
jgi:hypothetical protein